MKLEGVSAVALILIASFAIDRLVAALLFVLSFIKGWAEMYPEPSLIEEGAARLQAEKRRKLIYFLFAAVFSAIFLQIFGNQGVFKTFGLQRPVMDYLLTMLILVGGSDRLGEILKTYGVPSGEKPASQPPIEIKGRLILEEGALKRVAGQAG